MSMLYIQKVLQRQRLNLSYSHAKYAFGTLLAHSPHLSRLLAGQFGSLNTRPSALIELSSRSFFFGIAPASNLQFNSGDER